MARSLLFEIADELVKTVYKETLNYSYKYQSSIGDQLRRASLSVVLNIVEGGARHSLKEKRQSLNIAFGSLKETKYLIYFSRELSLITNDFYISIMEKVNRLARLMYGILYRKE